jgi:hypothetical protein
MIQSKENSAVLTEEGITYKLMDSSDLTEAAACFTNSFQREPMVKTLNISKEAFLPFAVASCKQAVEKEMALVAIDETTGKMAGFTILQDALEEIDFDSSAHTDFLPIFEMLGHLQSKYISEKNITQAGEVVVSFVTGVQSEYQGAKVAIQLFGQSIQLAKSKQYKKMITEVTGRLSQNGVKRRYAFTPYDSILYRDFSFEGQLVFSQIEDQSLSCVLMEKCLLN